MHKSFAIAKILVLTSEGGTVTYNLQFINSLHFNQHQYADQNGFS